MKPKQKQIITILADGRFHSGEKLAKSLGVTRSAIWKIIHDMERFDIPIFSLPKKGYQIPDGVELLDETKIRQQLSNVAATKIPLIEIFDSIPSTNEYLLAKTKNNQSLSGQICLAEHQSAGYGRRGREWYSPFGSNLYFSMVWDFGKDPAEISGLSLALAVAIVRTLKHFQIENHLQLKWPNDILWNYKKLGGVLLEITAQPHEKTKVVIGVGLNVNMPKYNAARISQPWTDLKSILRKNVSRNLVVAILINNFVETLEQFNTKGLSAFLAEWQKYDATFEKNVVIQTPQHTQQGVACGVSEKGELLLRNAENQVTKIMSGEVSLRLA